MLKDQLLPRDVYGRVTSEKVQAVVSPSADQSYNWGKDCCGKNSVNDSEGNVLASAKHSRGGVQAQLTFAKELAESGAGGLSQIQQPWNVLIDPEGDPAQNINIEFPIIPGGLRYWVGSIDLPRIDIGYGDLTGKPTCCRARPWQSFSPLKHRASSRRWSCASSICLSAASAM